MFISYDVGCGPFLILSSPVDWVRSQHLNKSKLVLKLDFLFSLYSHLILMSYPCRFADPIKRGGYSNASPMQVQLAYRCALVLRDLINPYLLRRQKKDVKEVSRMPGKTEHVLFCRLSKRQRALYEAYLRSDEVASVVRGSTQLLKAITGKKATF
jgi:SNF2-related domain